MTTNNNQFAYMSDECINSIMEKGEKWVDNMLVGELTLTRPGSISHLLYGSKPYNKYKIRRVSFKRIN